MSKTDTKDGYFAGLEDFGEVVDGFLDHRWVTWTVGNEETIVGFSLGTDVVVLSVSTT